MDSLSFTLPEFVGGSVWLVGAGPGDPGLLSLLALHALRHADVILYDALIDERIMRMAQSGVEQINVGKRGGHPSPKQSDISERLIAFALQGLRVLRLKGGDPFMFGRGSEEAQSLHTAGIPFRVVPGVTAGIAGPAYAGIPVTSRDINSVVTFLTGHAADGDIPGNLDWAALGRASPVLVFYMALRQMETIARELIAGGRSQTESVAVICNATTERQTVLQTTLGQMAQDVARNNLKPPAIVIVGEVVGLRSTHAWWRPEEA